LLCLVEFTAVLITHNTARINRLRIILLRVSLDMVVCCVDRNRIRDSTFDARYMQTEGLHHSSDTTINNNTPRGIHVPAFNKQFAK
jgi:hypothetical protein